MKDQCRYVDLLQILFTKSGDFNREKDAFVDASPDAPTFPLAIEIANEFLSRFRMLTGDFRIRNLIAARTLAVLEYLGDDGQRVSKDPSKLSGAANHYANTRLNPLPPHVWDAVRTTTAATDGRAWDGLLLDAVGLLGHACDDRLDPLLVLGHDGVGLVAAAERYRRTWARGEQVAEFERTASTDEHRSYVVCSPLPGRRGPSHVLAAMGLSRDTALGVLAVLAIVAAAVDGGVFGFRPPFFRRQVNEDWLPRYRGWLYGVGFGWQVGVGVATYIMTAAVFLTVAIGVLTGSPAAAKHCRARNLFRAASTEAGELYGIPSRSAAKAAINVGRSAAAMMPSNGPAWAIASAAERGSSKRTGIA